MVFKVAKEYQPSVIYIDQVERYFASDKKTVKQFVSAKVYSPDAPKFFKLFKKMFVKYFSNTKSQTNISMTDQVMVIANANLWWLAPDQQAYLSTLPAGKNPKLTTKKVKKALKKFLLPVDKRFFDKVISLPLPDYASLRVLWKTLIEKRCGGIPLQPDFDLSTLTFVSENYSAGAITDVVNQVLSDRRVDRLPYRPLVVDEFVTQLSKREQYYKDDYLKVIAPFIDLLRPDDGTKVVPEKKKKKK
jgi:SpoVK/Ycf46/Vps4 family AAA+-type ATPase